MSALQQFRALKSEAFARLQPFAKSFTVPLPVAPDECFPATEGADVLWSPQGVPVGRGVRVRTKGEAAMSSHFHASSEIIVCISGAVALKVEGALITLTAKETYTIGRRVLHSAHYLCESDVFVWWPDLDADELDIKILAP